MQFQLCKLLQLSFSPEYLQLNLFLCVQMQIKETHKLQSKEQLSGD